MKGMTTAEVNAASMYAIAKEVSDNEFQKDLFDILSEIKNEADAGNFELSIFRFISHRIEAELQNRKFKIDRMPGQNEFDIKISWNKI